MYEWKTEIFKDQKPQISIFAKSVFDPFNGFSQAKDEIRYFVYLKKIAHFLKNFAVTKAFWRVKFKRQFSFLVYRVKDLPLGTCWF